MTIRIFVLVSCVALLSACGGGGGGGPSPTPAPAPTPAPPAPTSVSAAVTSAQSRGVDAVFARVEQGGIVTASVAGVQNRDTEEPAQVDALFKIASVSKLFLAAATTKLAVQGQLSVDDTVSDWVPSLADRIVNGNSITIRQLVEHRSGIPDFDSQPLFSWRAAHRDVDETLELALDLPADFAPGARFEYSNTNYVVLAKILDAALGGDHKDYMQDFILTPLGMHDTYLVAADAPQNRMAHGYWDDRDTTTLDYVLPGGSMVSSLADVSVFMRALARGNTLFSDDERELYETLYWYDHSGWVPGYQSRAGFERSLDAVVVVFVNNTGGVSEAVISQTYDDIIDVIN